MKKPEAEPSNMQAEVDFLIRKTGQKRPLNELRMLFFHSQGAKGETFKELEKSWLVKTIIGLSGTPDSKYNSDLWKQLNALSGFTVSQFEDENRKTYFLNAT